MRRGVRRSDPPGRRSDKEAAIQQRADVGRRSDKEAAARARAEWGEMNTVSGAAWSRVLEGELEVKPALEDVARQWEVLMRG